MKNENRAGLKPEKYVLLKALAAIICFVIFPAVIINFGLNRIFELRFQNRIENINQKMSRQLGDMEKFADGAFFSHFLLSNLCQDSQNNENWQILLGQKIKLLKNKYPESFRFIVADRNNNIIDNLSDNTKFRFLFKKSFNFLQKLKLQTQAERGLSQQANEKEFRILRPLLGDIINISELHRPFADKDSGKSILASAATENHHIWYNFNQKFNLIVFINRDFVCGNYGLKWAIDYHQQRSKGYELGFCSYPAEENKLYRKKELMPASRIVLALSRFEEVLPGNLLLDRELIFSCRSLSQSLRGYSSIRLKASAEEMKKLFFGKLLLGLISLSFILYLARKFGQHFSVKLKLLFLFGYSITIPSLIICFIVWDYSHQTFLELVKHEQEECFRILQTIDKEFENYLNLTSLNLKNSIDKDLNRLKQSFFDPVQLKRFKQKIADNYNVDAAVMINHEGNNLLNYDPLDLIKNESLILMTGKGALSLFRREIKRPEIEVNELQQTYAHDFVRQENKLLFLGMGTMLSYSFMKLLRPGENKDDYHLLLLSWQQSNLQKIFAEAFVSKSKALLKSRQLFAYEIDKQNFFLHENSETSAIQAAVRDAQLNQFSLYSDLEMDNSKHIAVAYRGNRLSQLIFVLLVPIEKVNLQMEKLRAKIWSGIFLFTILVLGSAWLSQKYLLSPLQQLKMAVEAFSQRNFRFRASILSENELGQLSLSFNRSLENLEELNVAEVVQQTLLPQQEFQAGCLQAFICSRSMSKLGGDCFNLCLKNKKTLQVFIGDAAGHGVSAALSVAMAKSILINEELNGFPSENILLPLNRVFFGNRKKRKPDLMTAQVFYMNILNGEYIFYNAGHVLPLQISNDGKTAGYISNSGFPIGLTGQESYPAVTGKLGPGETLVLSTDGIIESSGKDGAPLGFEGMKKLAMEAWNSDFSRFKKNLADIQMQLSTSSEDDQTIVLVKNIEKE